MNLHQIASGAIGSVNPFIPMTITRYQGYTTAADGSRTPNVESTTTTTGQWQNLNAKELQQLDNLNLEGDLGGIYLNGTWTGVVRSTGRGGDVFSFNGQSWLAVQVLENWPDWCKIAVCLQVS